MNLPDNWNSYMNLCTTCGQKYHESEGPQCTCDEEESEEEESEESDEEFFKNLNRKLFHQNMRDSIKRDDEYERKK